MFATNGFSKSVKNADRNFTDKHFLVGMESIIIQ